MLLVAIVRVVKGLIWVFKCGFSSVFIESSSTCSSLFRYFLHLVFLLEVLSLNIFLWFFKIFCYIFFLKYFFFKVLCYLLFFFIKSLHVNFWSPLFFSSWPFKLLSLRRQKIAAKCQAVIFPLPKILKCENPSSSESVLEIRNNH